MDSGNPLTPILVAAIKDRQGRQQRIVYRWIKEGHIRAMDSGKGNSGISEGMIFPPKQNAPTIRSRPDHIKLLITDNGILNALSKAIKE